MRRGRDMDGLILFGWRVIATFTATRKPVGRLRGFRGGRKGGRVVESSFLTLQWIFILSYGGYIMPFIFSFEAYHLLLFGLDAAYKVEKSNVCWTGVEIDDERTCHKTS